MNEPTNDIDELLFLLQDHPCYARHHAALTALVAERDRLRADLAAAIKQRDEARLQTGRLLNEIDCRIEHGADSNGHLEAIYNLFKEATDDR